MKIAVCFSGMIRTGVESFPNIKNFIGELWDDCDFFIHTWDVDYHNVLTGETPDHFRSVTPNIKLDRTKLVTLNSLYKFKSCRVEEYDSTLTDLKHMFSNYITSDQWIIPWFYSWHKSVILKKMFEEKNDTKYDIVIKLRPDVIFDPDLRLIDYINLIKNNDFGINMVYNDNGKFMTDDIVFISNSVVSDSASHWWIHRLVTGEYADQTYSAFEHFYNFLVKKEITPIDLNLHYLGNNYKLGLLRQECTMFNSLLEFNKCVECDRLHYHVLTADELTHITPGELSKLRVETNNSRKMLSNGLR
jgi:hypothetical protein